MRTLKAYIGRSNTETLDIMEDGSVIDASVIQRAVLRFGNYVLDTDTDDEIELDNNNTRINLQLGLVSDLEAGTYDAYLTLYDSESTEHGLAWVSFEIEAEEWPAVE